MFMLLLDIAVHFVKVLNLAFVSMSQSSLRSKCEIWLLGNRLEQLPSNRVPIKREVLRYFFFLKEGPMKQHKNYISNTVICSKITDELCAVWEKIGIKTQRKDKVKQKLTNLYESNRTLTKHKVRNDEKSQLFLNQLEELFYIAHQEAANIVQCDKLRNDKQKEEDLKFLGALKDGKKVVLGSVDKDYTRKL